MHVHVCERAPFYTKDSLLLSVLRWLGGLELHTSPDQDFGVLCQKRSEMAGSSQGCIAAWGWGRSPGLDLRAYVFMFFYLPNQSSFGFSYSVGGWLQGLFPQRVLGNLWR